MDFISKIIQFFGSPTFGVVLSLLLVFQWHKQHAKEQAVKNTLFSMRRRIYRDIKNNNIKYDLGASLIDDIDSILATLGSRKPFKKSVSKTLTLIGLRKNLEENCSLIDLEPEPQKDSFISPSTVKKINRNPDK